MSKSTKTSIIYELQVMLLHIEPPIWRTIHVESDITLLELHWNLQEVMGWDDDHLHGFDKDGVDYGTSSREMDLTFTQSEESVCVNELLQRIGSKMRYEYDYGDGWLHEIRLARKLDREPNVKYPRCVAGERACPPEDCGGPYGYANLLRIIADPNHVDHEEMKEWVGDEFDSGAFDIDAANKRLK